LLENHLIIGTPETCVRQIRRVHDMVGISHFNCSFWFGDLDQSRVLKSMELFSREVMPAFV
jgi:alkanesulfonate monooxygenase SsuD/methylene tetrahydromethanopterin reductase-like flavin-dependent oxidoreductase (luciferase family)